MSKKQPQHQKLDWRSSFPRDQYPTVLPNQEQALDIIAEQPGSVTLELPTGTGKTAIGYTFLNALKQQGMTPLFYLTPNKAQVEQVHGFHPDTRIAYGRSEHPCLYYPGEEVRADEIPCSLLVNCTHRVDQETGATKEADATPCPYLLQKYQAKQGGIVVATTAFYLFTQLFSQEWPTPAGLVIDEAHCLARTVRSCLSYEISDYHLKRSIALLKRINARDEAKVLAGFRRYMIQIIRRKPAKQSTLLEDQEIQTLIRRLSGIDGEALRKKVGEAIASGEIDPRADRAVLKQIEVLSHDIRRYARAFEFSLGTEDRQPLGYTYAYYEAERLPNQRKQYRLFIKSYYVVPVIKRLLSPRTLAYSATIGEPRVFGYETGIQAPFTSMASSFSAQNTRVFMPIDTPNLAVKNRRRDDVKHSLRLVAETCQRFARKGLRSLVVVISEAEREKFMQRAELAGLDAITYGDNVPAKEAARRFKDGEGDALVGTKAQFGEGVDLPKQTAPVIFFLRPGYPLPTDPMTVFEEKRFGGQRWALWNWRVMLEAMQVRGRNIRSADDLGVTFFVSQQFRRFLRSTLPAWLDPAYHGDKTWEQCVLETEKLLIT